MVALDQATCVPEPAPVLDVFVGSTNVPVLSGGICGFKVFRLQLCGSRVNLAPGAWGAMGEGGRLFWLDLPSGQSCGASPPLKWKICPRITSCTSTLTAFAD